MSADCGCGCGGSCATTMTELAGAGFVRPKFFGGMLLTDNRRAVAAGLTFRPLATTIRETLAWDRAEGPQATERYTPAATLTPEREAELLARR